MRTPDRAVVSKRTSGSRESHFHALCSANMPPAGHTLVLFQATERIAPGSRKTGKIDFDALFNWRRTKGETGCGKSKWARAKNRHKKWESEKKRENEGKLAIAQMHRKPKVNCSIRYTITCGCCLWSSISRKHVVSLKCEIECTRTRGRRREARARFAIKFG